MQKSTGKSGHIVFSTYTYYTYTYDFSHRQFFVVFCSKWQFRFFVVFFSKNAFLVARGQNCTKKRYIVFLAIFAQAQKRPAVAPRWPVVAPAGRWPHRPPVARPWPVVARGGPKQNGPPWGRAVGGPWWPVGGPWWPVASPKRAHGRPWPVRPFRRH